jgi:hypothetical protein
MDLALPVRYRNFQLNTITEQTTGPSSGCLLERVSYANVQGVGYSEKRSLGDGNDASDVFLSTRRINLSGVLYGASPAQLFDLKQTLVKTFSPTLAYREAPYAYGYLPLYWLERTLDPNFPLLAGGVRHRSLYCNVRPMALPQFDIVRDTQSTGQTSGRGATMSWNAVVEAKDPRIYITPEKSVEFNPGDVSGASGTWTNRGDYPAPIQVLINWEPRPSTDYWWHFTGGGSQMTIKLPKSSVKYTIRYDGYLKVLTLEQNGIEYLRMDLLDFTAELTHPLVPPGPSPSDWSWTRNTVPGDGLMLFAQTEGEEEVPEEEPPQTEAHASAPPLTVVTPLLAGDDSVFWFNEAYA